MSDKCHRTTHECTFCFLSFTPDNSQLNTCCYSVRAHSLSNRGRFRVDSCTHTVSWLIWFILQADLFFRLSWQSPGPRHLRRRDTHPGVNSGALADCHMSQSHTNKPRGGLLNRAKVRPTRTTRLCFGEQARASRKKRRRHFEWTNAQMKRIKAVKPGRQLLLAGGFSIILFYMQKTQAGKERGKIHRGQKWRGQRCRRWMWPLACFCHCCTITC